MCDKLKNETAMSNCDEFFLFAVNGALSNAKKNLLLIDINVFGYFLF